MRYDQAWVGKCKEMYYYKKNFKMSSYLSYVAAYKEQMKRFLCYLGNNGHFANFSCEMSDHKICAIFKRDFVN